MVIAASTDFRAAAKRRLPPFLFHYIDGAAYAEVTSARNVDDLKRIALRQRVLNDVSAVDLSTRMLGQDWDLPVGLGPIGLAGMYARRGEVQAARAAADAGVPFCLSTVSLCSLAEVRAAVDRPFWFQLYVLRDRGFMRSLLDEARRAGCGALLFTVDMPMPGARYRDLRSGMSGPGARWRRFAQAFGHPGWAWDVGVHGRPHRLGNVAPVLGANSGLEDYIPWLANNFDPSVTWRDLGWIRDHWDGPLVIKGILDPDDALEAVVLGADGIVVSNHGGRQLDGVLSTARALPAIVDAVGQTIEVLVDGGVRSGLDVARMLALGARGVLLGRAWAYALAAAGESGVAQLLQLIRAELRIALALTGVTAVDRLGRENLVGLERLEPDVASIARSSTA